MRGVESIIDLGGRILRNRTVRTSVFVVAAFAESALAHPVHAQSVDNTPSISSRMGVVDPIGKVLLKITTMGILSGGYFGSSSLMLRQMEGMSRRQRALGKASLVASGIGTLAGDVFVGFYF